MHRASLALLIALRVVVADAAQPPGLRGENIRLIDPWGDSLAAALADADAHSASCRATGSTCSSSAASPLELVPVLDGCAGDTEAKGWRHANELNNSSSFAEEMKSLASKHALFECNSTTCLAVFSTANADDTHSDVISLSACRLPVVSGIAGPPGRCEELLKQHPGTGLLLRAKVGNSFSSCSMGLKDFDAVFKQRAGDLAAVRRLLSDLLRAKPFNLSVMEEGNSIVGTRTCLPSDVLAGWREWVTVRVDIDTSGPDAGTRIYTTMLVSKQASANREDWSPPSEPQEGEYLRKLREEFQKQGASLKLGGGAL